MHTINMYIAEQWKRYTRRTRMLIVD